MAIPDLIVMSSSPPKPGMSSSPGLPTLTALVRPKARIGAGNAASSDSKSAHMPSLPSAANLMWDISDDYQEIATGAAQENLGKKPTKAKAKAKAKASQKPRVRKETNNKAESLPKKPRKSRAKRSEVAENEGAPKERATRKPRAKKETPESQAKISKSHVTKSSIGLRVDKFGKKRTTERVSSHFLSVGDTLAKSPDSHEETSNGLLLQEAVKRRINWTPPKSTIELSSALNTPILDINVLSSFANTEHNITKQLDLRKSFGYSNEGERLQTPKWAESVSPRKRKLIELLRVNSPHMLSPEKPKTVKKKPRTITELAISAYAITDDRATDSLSPPPLLQYFPEKDKASVESRRRIGVASNAPSRIRSRSPVKSSRASKPKKGTIEAPILLSPETALKRSAKQEFVFGTSSQLAREDSPTLLRDLQRAMRESNKIEDDVFARVEDWNLSASCSTTGRVTDPYKAQRNLWGAASLGVEGEGFLTLDLSGSPEDSKLAKSHCLPPCQSKIAYDSVVTIENDEWHEIDEENVQDEKTPNATVIPSTHIEPIQAQVSPTRISDDTSTVPIRGEASLLKLPTQLNGLVNERPIEQKPDYRSYVTAQLTKEIASYHFKPLKSRNQMIALLEKCWEGRNRVALGNLGTNGHLGSLAAYSTKTDRKANKLTETPKAPRGRPRKDLTRQASPARSKAKAKSPKTSGRENSATMEAKEPPMLRQTPKKQPKRAIVVEEIYDSDTPLTPSPPRRAPSKVRSPPPPLQLSASPDENSALLSPTAQQSRLHQHITRAITSAPPSIDPENLSWHEKILLYDPIVLEDLTRWLNTGALQEAGWDGEVDPKEVKAWCLQKSICCLWRENLRGGTRKRF